ncbi:MAG: hypothetical protein M0Z77_10440 [Thermoplasmatales archaeon]|jgi:hypothetical protein|nr:hypothetical protein [Candidatus Thermoplasmatota archaeon]MCL6003367.1 hypothetical protein [Candidatus Thermoplasmatota archaeon]MDA8056045.1 hypothetical protein [Thermoplasmatales archaeon]
MIPLSSFLPTALTAIISGSSGYIGRLLWERRKLKDAKVRNLIRIIGFLSDKRAKSDKDINDFNGFLTEEGHRLGKEIVRIIPHIFDALWIVSGFGKASYGGKDYNDIIRHIDGRFISANLGYDAERFYWLVSESVMNKWIDVGNLAIKEYNKLTERDVEVDRWMLKTVPLDNLTHVLIRDTPDSDY